MIEILNLGDGVTTFPMKETPIPVPEPGTAALLALGLVVLGARGALNDTGVWNPGDDGAALNGGALIIELLSLGDGTTVPFKNLSLKETPIPIPEPGTGVLLGLGLALLVARARSVASGNRGSE